VKHHDRADVLADDADLAVAPDDTLVLQRVGKVRRRGPSPVQTVKTTVSSP
jgi:hypothetical protein